MFSKPKNKKIQNFQNFLFELDPNGLIKILKIIDGSCSDITLYFDKEKIFMTSLDGSHALYVGFKILARNLEKYELKGEHGNVSVGTEIFLASLKQVFIPGTLVTIYDAIDQVVLQSVSSNRTSKITIPKKDVESVTYELSRVENIPSSFKFEMKNPWFFSSVDYAKTIKASEISFTIEETKIIKENGNPVYNLIQSTGIEGTNSQEVLDTRDFNDESITGFYIDEDVSKNFDEHGRMKMVFAADFIEKAKKFLAYSNNYSVLFTEGEIGFIRFDFYSSSRKKNGKTGTPRKKSDVNEQLDEFSGELFDSTFIIIASKIEGSD